MASLLDRLKAAVSIGNKDSWSHPAVQQKPQPRVNAQQLAQALQVLNHPAVQQHLVNAPQLPRTQLNVSVAPKQTLNVGNKQIAQNPNIRTQTPARNAFLDQQLHPDLVSQVKKGLQEKLRVPIATAQQAQQMAQDFVTKPIAYSADSLRGTQHTYHPNSNIEKFVFGDKPIQNIEKNVKNNYDTHPNLPTPARVGLAGLDALAQVGMASPSVGGAVTGLGKGAKYTAETLHTATPKLIEGIQKLQKLDQNGFLSLNRAGKHPAVEAIDQHLKDLNTARDHLVAKNAPKTSIQANTKAYKLALQEKQRIIKTLKSRGGINNSSESLQPQLPLSGGDKNVPFPESKPNLASQGSDLGASSNPPGSKALPQTGSILPDGSPSPALSPTGKIQGKPQIQSQVAPVEQGLSPSASLADRGVSRAQQTAKPTPPIGPGKRNPRLPVEQSFKNRGFVNTILSDTNTAPEIKKSISSLYSVRNTKELQQKAATLVKERPDIAEQLAYSAQDDTAVAVGSELIKTLQKSGNFDSAINLAEKLAGDLTKAGQTSQAASIYGRLTPGGILRFTQREMARYNQATGKAVQLTTDQAKKLTDLATKIQGMAEGYGKKEAIAKLVAEVQRTMPSTFAEKVSTFQTMAQLLNPKTNIRNIAGNTIFGGLENISQTIATPVDKLLSLATGKRTTAIPNLKTQFKSGITGGKQAISEAKQGINTGPNTQYELNSVPVFRNGIMSALEKTMNGTLRGADRAAYKAAFDDSIKGSLKLAKTDKISPEMIEQAHYTGLYRTFQDSNAISDMFVGFKRTLNKAGIGLEGKRFGLGDLVLKYPKTPANLLARGLDYSPVGFGKAVFKATEPLIGKEFNQKAFVDAFSRAIVGSGSAFFGGYVLAKNGIITAQPEKNKDLRNLQKTEGLGGYQINASALKRWVLSGFNKDAAKLRPGDTLASYDWAQPIAIPVSAGASLGTEKPVKAGADSVNTLAESANTLAEQPLLQGIQRLFNSNQSLPENIASTAQGAPSSFIPTALSQVNQLTDNTTRNTVGKGGFAEGSINQVKAKVPILAQSLPKQADVLGNDKERYQNGTNNPFNVFLNPSFISKYRPNNTAETSLDLYKKTGETKQLPNTVKPNIKINGQNTQLTGQQQHDYQHYVGQTNKAFTEALITNPKYKALTDAQKVNIMSSLQSDINSAAKISLFGDKPDKITTSTQNILDGNGAASIESKLNSAEKANKPKVPKVKTSKAKKVKVGRASKGRKSAKPKAIHFKLPSTPHLSKVPRAKNTKAKQLKFKVATGAKKVKKIKLA